MMANTPLSQNDQSENSYVKTSFWHTYLGLILQLPLLVVLIVIAAIVVPIFFNPRNWFNLFLQSVPNLIMALAIVLPVRVKGIDLSAGAVFAASACVFAYFASENMAAPGLIIALVIGLAVGSINGTVNMFIRIPSAVLTMIVSAAVTLGVSLIIGWSVKVFWSGKPVFVVLKGLDVTAAAFGLLFLALILVLALLYFTKLGTGGQVQKRYVFMSYAASGLLFSIAACYLVMRLNMGSPMLAGSANVLYLLFAAGAIMINRSDKVRFMPVVCALLAALNWSAISNILALCGVDIFNQYMLQFVLAAAILTPAFMVQRHSRSRS